MINQDSVMNQNEFNDLLKDFDLEEEELHYLQSIIEKLDQNNIDYKNHLETLVIHYLKNRQQVIDSMTELIDRGVDQSINDEKDLVALYSRLENISKPIKLPKLPQVKSILIGLLVVGLITTVLTDRAHQRWRAWNHMIKNNPRCVSYKYYRFPPEYQCFHQNPSYDSDGNIIEHPVKN